MKGVASAFVNSALATPIFLLLAGCAEPETEDRNSFTVVESAKIEPLPINPWPNAAKVQLFIDDGDLGGLEVALKNGAVATLSDSQRAEFEASLSIHTPETDDSIEAAACFIPHHFFRYLAENGTVLGDIKICFCCGGNRFSPAPKLPEGGWIEEDIDRIAALVREMGHPVDIGCHVPNETGR